MRWLSFVVCAVLLLSPGCKKPDPNSIEDQLEILKEEKSLKKRLKAVENLKRIGKKEAVPGLIEVLKDAPVSLRAEIAAVLGSLKDPSAVQPLVDAIDFAAGGGSDKMSKEANAANKEIARALGDLGDRSAVKPLVRLLRNGKDDFVRIEAISALGILKDPEAVGPLSEAATDETIPTLLNKKAIMALAAIAHPDALPVFLKMAFYERGGSFYPESAFGVFMLGDAAKDRVLQLLKGQDKELSAFAKKHNIIPAALYAKATQMEADLQDPRAIPVLLNLLKYKDADDAAQMFVRTGAADTLGRMRSKEAVAPLAAMLEAEEMPTVRATYARALAMIGASEAVPKMVGCTRKGIWESRQACAVGLVQVGGQSEVPVFDALVKEEGGRFDSDCREGLYGEDVDCKAVRKENVEAREKLLRSQKEMLATVAACSDTACWQKLLSHAEPAVRERAALELGRAGGVSAVDPLLQAIKQTIAREADVPARVAAICALDWVTQDDAAAKTRAKGEIPALEALVEKDSQSMMTQRSAEEVKRLAIKLGR